MTLVAEMSPGKKIRVSPRYLKPDQLGGVIFDCTDMTIEECLTKQLFGLPPLHYSYVQNIQPGLPLFLFNYSTRQLHGIFEVTSSGQMNINPSGWTKDVSEKTPYPAQVRIRVQKDCHPLLEKQFQPIINKNYYTYTEFRFELDRNQVSELIALFSTQVVVPSVLCDEHVDPNLQKQSDGTEPSSCLDKIHQPVRTALEEINQDELNLICESLQKLPQRGESINSYRTDKVQEFENVNKMHDKVDGSQERNMAQVENIKEGPSLPSDVQSINSIIAELQELNAFKQESIETIGQLQQSQEKLLQELTAFKQKPIETIDQLQTSQQKLWQEFKASKQKTIGKIGQLQKSQQKLLQDFKAFKQESIKTTGQLQHSQQNLVVCFSAFCSTSIHGLCS